MKFREIISEEGDVAGTVAADIAHVTYPLFVRGRTRKEKRKNARAAVGQSMDSGRHTSIIGRGVFEANEAHVVDHNNVIYRLDTANPMDDTEVLVLGGAGRYTLKSLRNKARREIAELSKDLEVDHSGAFRRSSENIKQLTNTLNTIVAAYNQLERIRQRGGSRSRGIRREHLSVVREGIAVVGRAVALHQFSTMEHAIMEGGCSLDEYYRSLNVQEKAPPGFDKKLYKELIDRYGETSRAYATMWSIHNKTKGKK
jgi:hypothetical protein